MMIRSTQGWSAFFAVLLGITFTVAAFYNTDAEVYLFPRIASGFMLFLALVQWASVVINTIKRKDDTSATVGERHLPASQLAWGALLPGLMVGTAYVLIMDQLGFYSSSLLAFVIIISIYGRRKVFDIKALSYKVMVGFIFVVILYALFWKLLNVRTPTGILF